MIAAILTGLLKTNLAASAAILIVLALRALVRTRFGAWAAYLLWLAPLAAAAAVLAPHPAARTLISPVVLSATAAMDDFIAVAPAGLSHGTDLTILAFGLWLMGALAAIGLLIRRQAAFLAAMGRLTPFAAGRVFRAEHTGVGPAVVGVLRPRIVAPADFETRFASDERDLILAHERVHLSHGDAAANAVACAAQCLCWFNPLVHLAARLLRIDQELACDATVVGRFPAQRRTYAELLLKTQLATQTLPLGCHWPAGAEHPLKARIAMLKSPLPEPAMRGLGLAVVGCLTLGAASIAWAVQPGAAVRDVVESRATLTDAPAADASVRAERRTVTGNPHRLAQASPDSRTQRVTSGGGEVNKAIISPEWIEKPGAYDLGRFYPVQADKDAVGGMVTLDCHFAGDGKLTACKVASETPPGDGFGEAALRLTGLFRAKPVSREGTAVSGAAVRIPIRFLAPDRDPNMPGPASPIIAQPVWLEKPNGQDMARLYPAEATGRGESHRVTMVCIVDTSGRLPHCNVPRGASPADAPPAPEVDPAFAAATLQLAKLFRMAPETRDGMSVAGALVRIPVLWAPARPN